MNLIYDSHHYCVVEYLGESGFEVVDRTTARGLFLHGECADRFAECIREATAGEASSEQLDAFPSGLDAFYTLPVVYR